MTVVRPGALVIVLALVALTSSCAGDSSATQVDAGSDGGEAGSSADVGAPGSCLRIRACASLCADAACRQRCIDQASPPERSLYEQLETCTRAACPDAQDATCRCEVECVFPGTCTDLQDMCSQGMDDPQCVRCF
jgi:hypothetical protein